MAKTWFITGASSGFGRELTELLLERGDRVAATVRKPDALASLASTYGDRLLTYRLEVTDGDQVKQVVDDAFADLGRIDVIVSNAGYALFGAAEEVTMHRSSVRSREFARVHSSRSRRHRPPAQARGRANLAVVLVGGPGGVPDDGCVCRDQVGHRGVLRGHDPRNSAIRHRGDQPKTGLLSPSFSSTGKQRIFTRVKTSLDALAYLSSQLIGEAFGSPTRSDHEERAVRKPEAHQWSHVSLREITVP